MYRAEVTNGIEPQFPALTPAQRYHLEVNGYVVVEGLLDQDEIGRYHEALQRLKDEFFAKDDPWNANIRNSTIFGRLQAWAGPKVQFDNYLETDPLFLDYVAHPRIVGVAQEVIGNQVRLSETQAIINSRNPNADSDSGRSGRQWHHIRPGYWSYTENGLFHCSIVKALTNLTDLGPDDGGTTVIAGSHKLDCAEEDIVAASREDPSLVHQVIAPAGSTLFFCETLLHSSGAIRSDRERVVIIAGYQPANVKSQGVRGEQKFLDTVPEALRTLIGGTSGSPRPRRRILGTAVGAGRLEENYDGWSVDPRDPDRVDPNTTPRTAGTLP